MSCVIRGTVRPGNHSAMTRSTLMKVMASPAPTSTRAAIAVGRSVGQRERELSGGHGQRTGEDHPPGAEPVQGHADGHLQGRVDGQLENEEQRRRPTPRR